MKFTSEWCWRKLVQVIFNIRGWSVKNRKRENGLKRQQKKYKKHKFENKWIKTFFSYFYKLINSLAATS